MAPTEAERFELREGLSDVLEEGPVTTLMDSLPPMDWHELATKSDLAALEERMDAKFEVVDARFEALRFELGAKIDKGLTALDAKITAVDAKIDRSIGRIDKRIAQHTYVVLAGVAALVTPIYLALFALVAGFGG